MTTATKNKPSVTLDSIRSEVQARRDELAPLAAEFNEVDALWAVLSGQNNGATVSPSVTAKRVSKRPAQRQMAKRAGNRRGRPAGSGHRATEALGFIAKNPGATTNDIAAALGIKANYLYRVLPTMVEAGQVVKDGTGYKVA